MCNSAVQFVIRKDPSSLFHFAPLQSEVAFELIGDEAKKVNSLILVEGNHVYRESDAALHIARRLSGWWKYCYGFIIIPRFLRNLAYRFIAKNRYRWFGRNDHCMIPTPELQSRFLDSSADLVRFASQ